MNNKAWVLFSVLSLFIFWYIYMTYLWDWKYIDAKYTSFAFSIENGILNISDIWEVPISVTSKIDYQIVWNSIHISLYKKYFRFVKNYVKSINIVLPDKWIYKIYYKNSDWSLIFIKEINNITK